MSHPIPSKTHTPGAPPPSVTPQPDPSHGTEPKVQARRIYGIQPALFVGMCLLALVTFITVILIFTGDFESQAERVGWTVFVFLAFTGLLALDLMLARKDSTPLVLGVAGNTYLLAVLMLAIWMKSAQEWELGGWLAGVVILTLVVVRAAVAAAWGLLTVGRKSGTAFGHGTSKVASVLLGLAAVLLTFHFVMDGFGMEPSEFYWRTTVAVIVVSALASSVTVLLFWNRRNLDWEAAEATGIPVEGMTPTQNPHVAPGQQQGGDVPPVGHPAPQPQVPYGGLLPWPTFPDGTPYPVGSDGQPVFPTHQRPQQ